MSQASPLLRALGLWLALSAVAAMPASAANHSTPSTPATSADVTDGEVRKVDNERGRLTLKHAEIKSLDMPGMRMVFVVKDKALLDKLKVGDKVTFKAISDAGKFTVTEMQVLP